jgi:hypothetical protein
MKQFSQASAAGGHFSKSARSGAPPVFSVNVERQTRVILSTDDLGHPPVRTERLNFGENFMMEEKQKHARFDDSELVEVWFKIEKDADGYPESKSWEGLLSRPEGEAFRLLSVPFYLKNVSRGDLVAATTGQFLEFNRVLERGGHNTYRLLLKQALPDDPGRTVDELVKMGLAVEEEKGILLAVDVPQSVNQTEIDSYLVAQAKSGRWEMQDGFLSTIETT